MVLASLLPLKKTWVGIRSTTVRAAEKYFLLIAALRKCCPFWIEESSISIKILNPFRVKVNPNNGGKVSCRHATTPKMSKLLGGYGQQPTSSPGHGGWQQPTLKADLSTWANGLVTGRYCWQTELCVPCSTSEDTALAALHRSSQHLRILRTSDFPEVSQNSPQQPGEARREENPALRDDDHDIGGTKGLRRRSFIGELAPSEHNKRLLFSETDCLPVLRGLNRSKPVHGERQASARVQTHGSSTSS